MRERTGQIIENKKNNEWIARVCYKNSNGKRTAIQRKAESKADAKKILRQLLETLENGGREAIDIEKATFNDLADYYEKHYAKPAKFIDNRKVEGLRDLGRVKGFLNQFSQYFGKMKLRQITYGDILTYRNERLNTETHYKKARTIATMNRELASLRRIFNIAQRQGWIERNPVNCGESLIDISAERRRERILTFDEEKRLLEACTGRRKHLKPLIISLLSTGARLGETLKLKWSDIDLENRLITFRALNTKTLKTRKVAITNQFYDELLTLWNESDKKLDSSLFNFKGVRKAFETACTKANIETGRPFGITLHSLRHTVAVRLVKGNFPLQFTARILGVVVTI
jgi:integrase